MTCATAVISRWMSWARNGAACLAVATSVGCTGEFARDAEDEDEADFRADGCGAGLQKGTASQTCKYKTNADRIILEEDQTTDNRITAIGTCDGDAKLKCVYTYHECKWDITSTTTCVKQQPSCPAAPDVSKITLNHTFDLTQGDTTCDPPGSVSTLASACMNRRAQVVNGKRIDTTLYDACKATTTPDVTRDVSCCVEKPPGETSSGGCDSGTAGTDATGGWTTSASTGDDGTGAGSSSATGGPGECPEGSTWQCGADQGPLQAVCACVAQAL